MAEEGGRKMDTGARTGGEPSGAHWDHRAEAWDTAGGPGRYTNTGHGDFVGVDKSRPSSNDVDNELPASVVGACKSHSSNIVDVLSGLLDKARVERCSQLLDASALGRNSFVNGFVDCR